MGLNPDTVCIDVGRRDLLGHPLNYRKLNLMIRQAAKEGAERIILSNVLGQRYIAASMDNPGLHIEIHGTPGNDLGAFLDDGTIEVFGNAQDVTANTMNGGEVIVHGDSGDITGLAARGGVLLVKGNAGYRVGTNIKGFDGKEPSLVIGGFVDEYLGEYMAGGTILVLGLGCEHSPVGMRIGAGMHGGRIYICGRVLEHQLGPGARLSSVDDSDLRVINSLMERYERAFSTKLDRTVDIVKVIPISSRPFSGHYDASPI